MTEPRDTDQGADERQARVREERGELADAMRAGTAPALDPHDAGEIVVQRSLNRDAFDRFRANRLAMAGLVSLIAITIGAIVFPMLASDDALRETFQTAGPSLSEPFQPLGTDRYGRDMWTVAWLGARVSLSVAFAVAAMILLIGATYGAIAGYVGGWLENLMMRFLDALYGLPYLPFAIILVVFFSARFPNAHPILYVVPALALTAWLTSARVVRGQVMSLRRNEYVEAALAGGASSARIITKHIMPNTVGVLIVIAFLEVPAAILGEATLSFLGLGIPPGDPSWGSLANEGASVSLIRSHPHLILVPGIFIAVTTLSATAIADGLRDALDPRSDNR